MGALNEMSTEDLRAWAAARGVEAVLGLRVTMVSGLVSEELLRTIGCGWSNAPTVLEAVESVSSTLRQRVQRFLDDQVTRRKAAEREDAAWLRALVEPEDETLLGVHKALIAARAIVTAAIGPRAREVPRARFEIDAEGPGFSVRAWVSDPLYAARGDGLVWIDAARWQTDPIFAKCGCPFGRAGTPCVHALMAIDEALFWTSAPATPERDAEIVRTLGEPPWQRLLSALDDSLEGQSVEPRTEVLGWRARVAGASVVLEPCVRKIGRGGVLSAGSRIDPAKVPHLSAVETLPADLLAADALCRDAHFEAAAALVDHPRVTLEGVPATVGVGQLGVGVSETAKGLMLLPTLDGVVLDGAGSGSGSGAAFRALRDAIESGAAGFVVVEGAGVKVVPIVAGVREVVRAALRHPHPVPKAHAEKLVQRLPALERVAPVLLPEAMRGEEVISDPRLTLRMTAKESGIAVEAWVNPLSMGNAPRFRPGDGPVEVAAERDGTRVYTRRDRAAEKQHADRILARLPLPPRDGPWTWLLPNDEAALDLLAAIKQLDEPVDAEWRDDSERQLHFAGEAHHANMRVKEGRDWFELEGEVHLDGDRIKLGDILEAMRRGHRYVRLDLRRWMRIEQTLRERLEKLSHTVHASRGKLELSLHSAPALRELDVESDTAWLAVMKKLEHAEAITPEVPAALQAELRPYQREGFTWMARLSAWGTGGILADDMGLGKTVQALALLVERGRLGPQLVIAPTSVCFNWLRECERFAPTLKARMWGDEGAIGPNDVLVCSYGIATRDQERLSAVHFATAIFDEAQAVKNAGTARAKAARKIDADIRFGLSGTPIENHLGELWSLLRTVSPGLLGSWEQFRTRFLLPIEKDDHVRRRQMLADLVRPFILRRTKAEVLRELPPVTEIKIDVAPSAEERELYETARMAAVTSLARTSTNDKTDARFAVLAAITKLRLLACHPQLFEPTSTLASSKLETFLRLADELRDNRHRALVFSQFTSHLALVRKALDERGIAYHYLDGTMSPAERDRAVRAFQSGDRDLFLISLKAGGMGLNLTAADYVVHLDPWWNPAVEEQATGRAHRIGQTRPVTVYRLVSTGTIEEQILRLHDDKRNMIAGVLDDNDVAARLTVDELKALLRNQDPCTSIFTPSPKT